MKKRVFKKRPLKYVLAVLLALFVIPTSYTADVPMGESGPVAEFKAADESGGADETFGEGESESAGETESVEESESAGESESMGESESAAEPDPLPPRVEISKNRTAPAYDGGATAYYTCAITLTIIVTDADFDPQSTIITAETVAGGRQSSGHVLVNGEEGVISADSWKDGISREDGAKTYKLSITFDGDGNYLFQYTIRDYAGHMVRSDAQRISIDTKPPVIDVRNASFSPKDPVVFAERTGGTDAMDYGLIFDGATTVTIMADDDTGCGVERMEYRLEAAAGSKVTGCGWTVARDFGNCTYGFVLEDGFKGQIALRAVDRAGNITKESDFLRLRGAIAELADDAYLVIRETAHTPYKDAEGRTLYSEAYMPEFDISAICAFSGWAEASYERAGTQNDNASVYFKADLDSEDGILENGGFDISGTDQNLITSLEYKDAPDYGIGEEHTGLVSRILATCNAGHTREYAIPAFSYDSAPPRVFISWDGATVHNGKYYGGERLAYIRISDANIDPEAGVEFIGTNISDGAVFEGWVREDSGTWAACVKFADDGEYSFGIRATDMAGHVTIIQPEEFVIDMSRPKIEVSWDNADVRNGMYYNGARTAVIIVREDSFDETLFNSNMPVAWVHNEPGDDAGGDDVRVHMTTVTFDTDGTYELLLECTDLAGNVAEPLREAMFVIDTAPPLAEAKINGTGVKASAPGDGDLETCVFAGDISAEFYWNDLNLDMSAASVTAEPLGFLEEAGAAPFVEAERDGGADFVWLHMADVPKDESYDNVYLVTFNAYDLAGNITEKSFRLSINRYGPNFYVDDAKTAAFLERRYNKGENLYGLAEGLRIKQAGVSPVDITDVSLTYNGMESSRLAYGTQYDFARVGRDGIYEYEYVIHSSNFEREGEYLIAIHAQDTAGMQSSNAINRAEKVAGLHDGALISDPALTFMVDDTAPTVRVYGIEDGASYLEAERDVTVEVTDNLALADMTVMVGGDGSDDISSYRYDGEYLKANGNIVKITLSGGARTIRVSASDMAGNIAEQFMAEDGSLKKDVSALVTPDPLMLVSGGGNFGITAAVPIITCGAAGGIAIKLLLKRKRLRHR